MGIGSMVSFTIPAFALWRRGIASPAAELRYTLLGATLSAAVVIAVDISEAWIPLSRALRTLLIGPLVIAPYALWASLRVWREFRLR